MHKHLAVLAVVLAILSHSEATPGQNITGPTPSGDGVEANNSTTSNKTEDQKDVSLQASTEAKRLYKEAVKYGRGGLPRQASQLYEKAVQLNPNYAAAHYGLGQSYFDQRRWEAAILSFERAIKINPKDKEARARLEEARVLAGSKTESAQHSEEQTTSANPPSPHAWAESRPRNVTAVSAPVSLTIPTEPLPSDSKKASTPADEQPTSTVVNEKSSAIAADEKATSTPQAEQPASLAANEKSPAIAVEEKPASNPPADQPSSTAANEKSPAIAVEEKPASNPPADQPSSTAANETSEVKSAPNTGNDLTRIYHIGIGDVLDVRLGNEPASQSTLFTVTPSGLLEHPILTAPMQVAGLTVEDTRARLEADLKRRAVNENPRVLVGIREYLSHAIIVSGLVKEPGTKLLRREAIPLYVVIADAQPGPEAGSATLIRHETGQVVVADLAKPMEMNLLVRSGDVITVHASIKQFFYVGGEIKAPGEIQFRPGLTLTQAILTAGGLSREAKTARIARASEKGFLASTHYKLKDINTGKLADPLIQPGDRITVEH
jgi:protein involved in polysaccharide export with SLBB domain